MSAQGQNHRQSGIRGSHFMADKKPEPQKIALITDAWLPQVNGVVRTLQKMVAIMQAIGKDVLIITPQEYPSIACPSYPEIRLALTLGRKMTRKIDDFQPDAIHIATEGPLGLAARRYCLDRDLAFTTAYHTQFPDYIAHRTGLPAKLFWPYVRWFHEPSSHIMTATDSIRRELRQNGLTHLAHWGRGVDLEQFTPHAPPPAFFDDLPRPIQLYVGRVAVEKNITAFLENGHQGSKIVVGNGPAFEQLQKSYPDAHFMGVKKGAELAGYYAGADVFVFPSKTDTFGLVMIEALACGTPVAAYPVTGPVDILTEKTGVMADDLAEAIAGALLRDPADCIAHAGHFHWDKSYRQFIGNLTMTASPSLSLSLHHAA